MNDEKILNKVGKLLSMYGVSDEEKEKFIMDLQDKKYDDQEEVEEGVENKPAEEGEKVEDNENEKPAEEEEKVEEVEEHEEAPALEEEEKVEEKVEEAEEPEQPAEETPVEVDYRAKYEELSKSFEGLVGRMETLENIVSKLGLAVEDETIGASPTGTPIDQESNDAFDRFMRKRIG